MEKIFVKLQDVQKHSVFVNVNHIVSAYQNGTGTVTIELSTGRTFEDSRQFTQWEALMAEWVYKKG